MIVFIKILPPIGYYLGPTFSLTPNVGTADPSIVTVNDLLNGIQIDISSNLASSIKIISLGEGECFGKEFNYPIGQVTTTTTTIVPITTTSTSTTSTSTTTQPPPPPPSTTSTTSTSTSTTTTTPPCKCYKITNNSSSSSVAGTYNPCDGLGTFLIAPTESVYICTRYESSIVYTFNGGLASRVEITNIDPLYDYCPCSGVIPTTTTTTTIPSTTTSTSTSTTSTTTVQPVYTWNVSNTYPSQLAAASVGCENIHVYYTGDNLPVAGPLLTTVYSDITLTTPIATSGWVTMNNGTDLYIVNLTTGSILTSVPYGECNSIHVAIVTQKVTVLGVDYLQVRATVAQNTVLDNLVINGSFMTNSDDYCASAPVDLAVGFTITIPAGTLVGSYVDSPVLVASAGRESIYLNNLTVAGNTITNSIEFIDVTVNNYGIFSTFGTCYDIP